MVKPAQILDNLETVIKGKRSQLELLLLSILAGGHSLLEDVPGVGKTTLAKALATTFAGDFRRVQFTPDLLPTDILGSSIYSPKSGEFNFKPGPIFSHVVLADEINRASPRTQSALLEAMSEGQVTTEGNTVKLPDPFIVIATQNPVEFHGTYPLPEAQLDRFMVRFTMGYPGSDAELEMLTGQRESHPLSALKSVATFEDLKAMRTEVRKVNVSEDISRYILALIRSTREEPRFKLGSSPRGSLALYKACQAKAFFEDRDFVTPDDVKFLANPVLAHRIILETKTRYSGDTAESILNEMMNRLAVPA
ncbi:MAG TPA: MoxR family ATPase [Phycisphaerales bacterium]|nr:MoxR family ATPase [Phycisphaerales bacterium]